MPKSSSKVSSSKPNKSASKQNAKFQAKPAAKTARKVAAKAVATKGHGRPAAPGNAKSAAPQKIPSPAKTGAKQAGKGFQSSPSMHAGGSTSRRSVMSDICREVACEGLATSGGYCRLHYIKNWKKIQRKALILKEGKLNQYIEELVAKYPDKYIEAIRQDLANNREFSKVVRDLELDEGFDEFDSENENVDNIIDTIKRDIDDDEEVY